ncbi:hypothetical protein [Ochrobactrum sp. CGA5]|uniref:hypothetical protein n=1 Tax=Ochrobactrum sp. CGA5 TaxID=2583453 RepID=UPI00111FC8EC|nr:hypothetical protein [Ochrobactrum sp. CGA5]
MTYYCPTIADLQTDDGSIVVDRDISLLYDEYLSMDYVYWVQKVVDEVRDEFPYLRKVSEQRSIVIEQRMTDLSYTIKVYIQREVADNIGLIDRLMERLREPLYGPKPVEFKRRHNWQIFPSSKTADLKTEKTTGQDMKDVRPGLDLSKVPAEFEFMLTTAFKDQAKEFYKSLDLINSGSRPDWIRNYYVELLHDRWPHIARADIAMGGLISKVMAKVADDPRYVQSENWWRGFAIALSKGDGLAAYETCQRFLEKRPQADATAGLED